MVRELLEAEVDQVVGPKGRHNPERTAVLHGHENGEVTLVHLGSQVSDPECYRSPRRSSRAATSFRTGIRDGSVGTGVVARVCWHRAARSGVSPEPAASRRAGSAPLLSLSGAEACVCPLAGSLELAHKCQLVGGWP